MTDDPLEGHMGAYPENRPGAYYDNVGIIQKAPSGAFFIYNYFNLNILHKVV